LALLLYINGQLADLEPGQVIAQTKQVNDLNSLENRQTNYTNKFKIPKTAANLKMLDFLTVTGNKSEVPYKKNECSLFSETGECFIYNGHAVVTDGGDDFEVVVYDGIIDLYKKLENKTLGQLNLDEVIHERTVANVKSAMRSEYFGTPDYTYILADYNGNTGYTPSTPRKVNIDYLVPSINVKYLWNKIFSDGYTYSGSVFDTQNFKNLWFTYPKGVSPGERDVTVFSTDKFIAYNTPVRWNYFWLRYLVANTSILSSIDNLHLKITEAGIYRIEVSGNLNISKPVALQYAKNAQEYASPGQIPVSDALVPQINNGQPFEAVVPVQLEANDTICFFLKQLTNPFDFLDGGELIISIIKVVPDSFNFNEVFSDFSTRDFLTEIVHRFGLTMYKDKYSNHYEFLTLQEQLQGADVVNYSDKFVKKISENYIYGNYAQRNWLRYNYNDKESSHSDGYIDVANVNLPDSRDVIKSKIYSPDAGTVNFLGHQTRMYKLWDKEIVEEPEENQEPFTYKPLDKRFYFLRREVIATEPSITLVSPKQGQSDTCPVYNIERFYKLNFNDIVQDYYKPVKQILDKSMVVTAELYLQENDVANFDFRKLYYIEQLGNYFIMNKINNFVPGKATKCELVRVLYASDSENADLNQLFINNIIASGHTLQIFYTATFPSPTITVQHSADGYIWTSALVANITSGSNNYIVAKEVPAAGTYHVRLLQNDTGLTSTSTIINVS
jgi:hypothetical protein